MKKETIYPRGMRVFPKNEKQPQFVLGSLIITPAEFAQWVAENQQYLTDYNGSKQLKLQILNGDKGIYFTVDTYKKTETTPF
jgi:hypothetical protein